MTRYLQLLPLVMAVGVSTTWGQANRNAPHIGYVYPAGGQRGTTFEVIVGGQFLRGADGAHVSGQGVHAKVIQHYQPLLQVVQQHREEIRRRLMELIEKRVTELPGGGRNLPPEVREFLRAGGGGKPKAEPAGELPEHFLLRNLEQKSLRQLLHIRSELLNLRQTQPSRQIAESVLLEVTIDRNASLGDHELRIETSQGLTNPMCFRVGTLPETRECEPNDPRPIAALLPGESSLDLPILINGQIGPGDVDRLRFRARRGQQLAIEVEARRLVPYLADAVPGWFQATVTLYDAKGREVAFADDYRFEPDPVLFYPVPQDGEYQVEIRDALYRGRDDFVYRLAVGEQATIARSFPWIRRIVTTSAPAGEARGSLDNSAASEHGTVQESSEVEPNDAAAKAQPIDLPRLINGRISRAGDVDVFQFRGRAGQEIVAEVRARRLGSPLDSLLRLSDASGRVLEWNDDHEDKEAGLDTHHADSYLRAKLPADGEYYVSLSDAQHHGGPAYSYLLRVSAPRPDFALRLTPASINVRAGGSAPATVYALRKDGFESDIEVVLKQAPPGFKLAGGRIPAGSDQAKVTLSVPRNAPDTPVALQLEGIASTDGRTLRRPVVPCEDMMQAFIYRHLVPAESLLVTVIGNRPLLPVEWVQRGPVRLSAGGTTRLQIRVRRGPRLENVTLSLRDPPEGLSLGAVTPWSEGLAVELKADAAKAKPGLTGNLIIEAFGPPPASRPAARPGGGKGRRQNERVSLGVLPAIAFEIVKR